MKKQTKVLLAAAMMTIGASFTSMAALSNGTWVLNEEGWQYADKEGDYVEEEWCKSYGVEYWINDEDVLGGSEWVKDEDAKDRWYYAQSDGSKAINAWKYLYDMNDEDEEEDQYWYYFDAKGRMVTGKKTIGDYTYYFDKNGRMLTGWIEEVTETETVDGEKVTKVVAYKDATTEAAPNRVIYADENGAVVKSSWINVFPWTMNEDEAYEGEHEEWYYTTSAGKLNINKQVKVDGLSYIFDVDGEMLTEWVAKDYEGTYANVKAVDSAAVAEAYYCDADYGYMKKNGWRELESADGSDDYWFHFDKLGRAFLATDADAASITTYPMVFKNGEKNSIVKDTDKDGNVIRVMVNSKKIDGVVYYFNQNGEMIDGLQTIAGDLVYLEDGARQTGKVTLTDENENDYTFLFASKTDAEDGIEKYVAVEGNYDDYLYMNGQLITSEDSDSYRYVDYNPATTEDENGDEIEVVNGDYIVDYKGKVQHKDGKDYGFANKYNFNEDDSVKEIAQ